MSDVDKRLEELVRLATKPRQGDGVTMACDELCSVSIGLASSLLRAREGRRADARVRDALNELLPLIDTPRNGFSHEEDYVVWQRSINHWQQEGRAAIAAVPSSGDPELEELLR